jgi:hypothetical protein
VKSLLALLIVTACIVGPCTAQQHFTAPGRTVFSNSSGFGSVVYPGTGAGPQPANGNRFGRPLANGGNGGRARAYAYPVYVGGGYYGDSGGYGYAPQGPPEGPPPVNVTVVNAPPQVPSVVINQNFGPQQPDPGASETTRIYRTPPPAVDDTADAAPQPHYFLVAFKDHSVYSAFAYWIEDKTLHYVTPQQTHNQASLDLVDMTLTNQLNQR